MEKNYDVAVIGSGPAGIGAALAAARSGVSVVLIEKNSVLGGQLTSGLVTGFHGFRVHDGFTGKGQGSVLMEDRHTPLVVKGLSLEIMNRLKELEAAYTEIDNPPMRVEYDPEVLIPLLFRMCEESHVELMLNTFAFGVEMNGRKISCVKVANKSGETRIYAKMFIDASADGDVMAWSGCDYVQGSETDGRCMPLSIYQVLANVDLQKTINYMREHPDDLHVSTADHWQEEFDKGAPVSLIGLRSLVAKAAASGDYPRPLNTTSSITYPIFDIQSSYLPRGTVKLLVDMAYGIDITNGDDLTRAEWDMRMNQIPGIYRFMRKYVPGFENCYIVSTSSLVGTRESRRLNGQYVLTYDDIYYNSTFEDSIGRTGRAMNVHSSGGGDQNAARGGQQWIEAPNPIGCDIPYRSLLPKEVDNLLVSGRCISVDRNALGSIRGEPTCMVTGEAAGVAAAIAVTNNCTASAVPIQNLQDTLLSRNVVLHI